MKINEIVQEITKIQNEKGHQIFWDKNRKFENNELTIGEAICMASGELNGEAMEAYRDNDKTKFVVELADAVLRIFHLAGAVEENDFAQTIDLVLERCRTRQFKHGRENF